ncbi:hypothetical protein ACHAXH_006863 [Discostella pseudostelligera]
MAMPNRLLLLLPFTILMAPVVVHSFTPSSSNNNNRCAVPQKQRSATTTTTATITDSGSSSSRSNLFASRADLTTKEYQLEELEDREECETELWLNDDGSVTLGETNGPLYKSYHGDWHVIETASEDDKPFRMRLTRTYDASSRSGANKIGDFTYDITREFWGSIEMIGDSISVSGKMHGSSYNGSDVYLGELSMNESEVGYFTMIDSVASEDGVEGEKKW